MKRLLPAAAAAAALVVTAAGCSGGTGGGPDPAASAPDAALEPFYAQAIDWGPCPDGGAEFECGVFEVPMDYADPGGRALEIAVKRLPAEGESEGSLLVNPGGPGGSAYDYAGAATSAVSEDVRERLDVVGFDPRGVARSEPISCLPPERMDDYLGADLVSEDGDGDPLEVGDAGVEELEESVKGFVEGCRERAGDLMMHMGTENVARDMDVLRAVLGDERLTYLGKSYGTLIGAYYADLFPERVGAMVLDGALDPELDALETTVQQAGGFETALRAFVEDCQGREDCPLGGEEDGVDAGVDRVADLLQEAGREPLDTSADDGREVGRARVEMGIMGALYSEGYWGEVRGALTDAIEDGDGTALLRLGDRLYDRDDPRAFTNSVSSLVAVNCSDAPAPRDPEAYRRAAEEAAEASPLFGPSSAWAAFTCAYWPEEAVADPWEADAPGADPVLVVGTTRDSATPYAWAEELADGLDSGVLLTYEGDGHTAYRSGAPCVDAAVDGYLLEHEVPEDGLTCGA
ncbi:alpha/beta hydrolase [Nocardiopsis suaedae]|uniref:Alpha/beta hydrolase n=1 Tax=Nocardiopsis suaedae TaxID=3018444 RepID=A0ABT4TRU6_9ACTN|nr:alpha/beta hydrolase [Nocardiopsis suaedae]MDA2806989.1 alpha/beta hydrolase [Nocardiopsis suaedae]